MKKRYSMISKYLLNKNSEGGAGAGGGGGEGSPDGGAPPADANNQPPNGQSPNPVSWKESIPAELKDNPRFKSVETLDDLVKAYAGIQEAPVIPEKMALPEGVPEELGTWAVESGLTQAQFDATLGKYGEIETARLENIKTSNKAGETALYEAWGEDKEKNLQLANRVVQFADPDGKLNFGKFLAGPESNYAFGNPMIIQLFHNIGKAMEEGGALKGDKVPNNPQGKKVNKAHELYPNEAPKE